MNVNKANDSSPENKRWRAGKWIFFIAVLLVIYFNGWQTQISGRLQQAILWTGIIQPDTALAAKEEVKVDYNMPLVSLTGEVTNLATFKGKVIFLNFWATWCSPCLAELPNIQVLSEKYKNDEQIRFVMVSVDKDPEKARKFMSKKGYTFPAYQLAGRRPAIFQNPSIPVTYVISKDGLLSAKRSGMAKYDTQKFRAFLKKLKNK